MRSQQTARSIQTRGTYGQNDGGYQRGGKDSGSALTLDRYADNHIAEGDAVAVLNRMAGEQDWKGITAYTADLKAKGYAQFRIDSMLGRATAGLRF